MCPDESRPVRVRSISPTTIAVSGDIDLAAGPALRAALADPTVVVVDLAAVTFIDAAGLGMLLAAHRWRAAGITLRAPSRSVRRLLVLAGHDATFPILER